MLCVCQSPGPCPPLLPPPVPLSTSPLPAAAAFCGWYMSSFSHARRVIDPPTSLPVNDPSIAYWDAAAGDCMSMWALQA
jgi:hypothetical protein